MGFVTMSYEWLFRIRWVVNSIWDLTGEWCWRAIWLPTGLLLLVHLHRHSGCGWHRAVADVLGNDSGCHCEIWVCGQRRKTVKREEWWLEMVMTWMAMTWMAMTWMVMTWTVLTWMAMTWWWLEWQWLERQWLEQWWLERQWLEWQWLEQQWLERWWLEWWWLEQSWLEWQWLERWWLEWRWLEWWWLERCRREILRIYELMKLRIFDIEMNRNQ